MKRRLWSKSFARSAPLSIVEGSSGTLLFVFMAIFAIAYSVFLPQSVSALRSTLADSVAPALNIVAKPIQDSAVFIRGITGLADLQAENMRLATENTRLREWYQAAMALDADNQSLRELMNVKIESHNRYITARVLADTGFSFVRSLLIYAGQNDGVRKGQAVVSGDGVIGRVVEAGNKVSRVLLIDDINSRIPVLVEKTQHHAVLAGQNDGRPLLVHLPPEAKLEEGDRIITSGHGGVFPRGLPIGLVRLDKENNPRISLFVDFDRMIYVRVIDKPTDPNLQRASQQTLAN